MDLEELIEKYPNVSRDEFEKIQETSQYPTFSEVVLEETVRSLNQRRENEKINGRESVIVGPLVQLLSVRFMPSRKLIDQNKPLTIYGRIYAEFLDTTSGKTIVHDLYSRKKGDAEVLLPSGDFTLISPDCSRSPLDICMPLNNNTRLVMDICVGGKMFIAKQICCADGNRSDLEQFKLVGVNDKFGSLDLWFIAMPFAVYGHVEVDFIRKKIDEESRSLNVKGKIVARYGNNECTLFEKQSDNEFERVEIGPRNSFTSMRLSRCWVGLPVNSSLIIDLDLLEFGTERNILKETVKLQIKNEMESGDEFILDDDLLISVCVGWHSPRPQGRQISKAPCVPNASSSNRNCPQWLSSKVLHAPLNRPFSSSAVEIFSVFIGQEKFKALQVYGSIQVSSDACKFYVFRRESKEGAFGLSEHSKTIPVLDGPRTYDNSNPLEMKIDLKDVDGRSHIRGYVNLDDRYLEEGLSWLDKQLCSAVQGQNGCFAAIHYTIFSAKAVQANLEVLCIPKSVDVCPKVYGSLVAQYNNYDYTSRYNKNFYRIVLFQRNREDPAQPGPGGVIELSRSRVVVPLNSSLVVKADFLCRSGVSDHQVLPSCSAEFPIVAGDSSVTIDEGYDYCVHIYVKWGEVSN